MDAQQNPRGLAGTRGQSHHENLPSYSTAPPVERLLPRLESVLKTGDRRWRACCPAHDGKSRSLAIREVDEGRVLIHCFAGCGAVDVIAAAGLTLGDLYPATLKNTRPLRPGERWIPREALSALAYELLVGLIILERGATGAPLDRRWLDRLALARARVSAGAAEVGA
ncbi:MAG: hypothetical protein IPN63_07775 [Gammaproteobacteria bacterium]|nr:hypothetical protein [Gammaproteobacteria bacterium]MBK9427273.1 hypothetical protein [Gammaproteobacteria bacterium]